MVRFRVGACSKVIAEQRPLFQNSSNRRAVNTNLNGRSLRSTLHKELYCSRAVGIVTLYLLRYLISLGNLTFHGGNNVAVDRHVSLSGVFVWSVCGHLYNERVIQTYGAVVGVIVSECNDWSCGSRVNAHYRGIDCVAFHS